MSRRSIEVYAYIAPLLLAPLSFWLWWRQYRPDLGPVLLAWLLPILYAYIVPAVGTNVLKVWEFDTRLRLGRFRPHHGFVFGSATAMIAWLVHSGPVSDLWDVVQRAIVFAAVLLLVNVLYEIRALRAGVLRVYNQPWADGFGPEAIALDYAVWFFGGFGAIYGAGLGMGEWLDARIGLGAAQFAALFVVTLALAIILPVLGYRAQSLRRHGHSGCHPVARKPG